MTTYEKVNAGQPIEIQAKTWNAFVDAAVAHRQGGRVNAVFESDDEQPANTIAISNDTGADLEPFQVVGLDGVVITPTDGQATFERRVLMSGITPAIADHRTAFAITTQAIPAGAIGRAVVTGCTVVQIDITQTYHKFATVKDADATQLESASYGAAQILWQESGTGTKWGLVNLTAATGASPLLTVKPNANVSAGGSGTVTVWRNGSATTETIDNVYLDWMHNSEQISANKEALICWFPQDERWRFVGAECEA